MDNEELSYDDIVQQYLNNIVSYKGRIVYVEKVGIDKSVRIFDLIDQKYSTTHFSLVHFKPPRARLGMVNVFGSVLYLSRIPVRNYGIGIYRKNLEIKSLKVEYSVGIADTKEAIKRLTDISIANTLSGIYPSFVLCMSLLNDKTASAIAFDRQFAISAKGEVFYKTEKVGKVSLTATDVKEIEFNDGYKHLAILLEGNHERTIGAY